MPTDQNNDPQHSLVSSPFQLRFWGVRGNIATPGEAFIRYGGNTVCLEILIADQRLIFDGGTGLKVLGESLCQEMPGEPIKAHLFFAHSYWDRIQGFPFFKPAFLPGNCLNIYGSIATNGASIKHRLMHQMTRPNFPISLGEMLATLAFHNLAPGTRLFLNDGTIEIETSLLNSSSSCLGYRVTAQNQVMVYATDVEIRGGKMNRSLTHLARNADILIYDLAHPFYENYNGQGKAMESLLDSTLWQATVELVDTAQVKRLVFFHHDPWCKDADLDCIEAQLQSKFPWVCFAKEGMTIDLYD